jgi:uncharacterized membrane protein
VLLFFLYSLAGWLIEVTLKYIQFHRFINRGFFTGPICPIYGSGALLITLAGIVFPRASDSYGTSFLMSFLLCGTVEYLTSYLMEKRFHARWWDYSQKPMNLHGRVWIGNLILFGMGGIAILHLLNPVIERLFALLPAPAKEVLAAALLAVFAVDYVMTHLVLRLVKRSVESSQADNTEEISMEVRRLLTNRSYFYRRFADAYPEVIYRTERITARLAEVKAETERLRAEAEQQLEARREAVADRLEPATLIKSKIISKQNDLIEMLYHEQTASEEIKALKSEIDREKERLEERPLGALASDRRGDQRGRRSS